CLQEDSSPTQQRAQRTAGTRNGTPFRLTHAFGRLLATLWPMPAMLLVGGWIARIPNNRSGLESGLVQRIIELALCAATDRSL
ncbi:MAG: hypothetical protein ACI8W7_001912, partial [Gammaproteobacteria bacterium]